MRCHGVDLDVRALGTGLDRPDGREHDSGAGGDVPARLELQLRQFVVRPAEHLGERCGQRVRERLDRLNEGVGYPGPGATRIRLAVEGVAPLREAATERE